MIDKPGPVFDREQEWADLVQFAADPASGLRIGVVRGRRRNGKSFLLEHLCRATGGVYTLALRQSRTMALDRFGGALAGALGFPVGTFGSWVEALDAAVDALARSHRGGPPLLVLDEFPYLVAHSPELPSAIQALYDRRGPASGQSPFKLVLCGSAVSLMSTLLAGDQALRGRAVLDLRVGPFRFRDAADFWGCEPATALLVDSVLGGAPGYRDLVGAGPHPTPDGFADWLARSVMNPSHALFAEPEYLLAEDPRVGDRAIYHAIWEAVSAGATTPTQIGGVVGMEARSLGYHLGIMKDGGFIRYDQDILRQRHPVITVADPAVRFHHLVVRPNLADLELRDTRTVWDRSADVFAARILGPHFESLAREWVRWYAREAGLADLGPVGSTELSCREHGSHEVDVVALTRGSAPRTGTARIALVGEAKATRRPRDLADLRRLEHVRDLLGQAGRDASGAQLAIFARLGFTDRLRTAGDRGEVRLIDLATMYGVGAADRIEGS